MQAERKRRQLVVGPGAGDVQERAGGRVVTDRAAALTCAVAEAKAFEPAPSPAALSCAAAEHEEPAETASAQRGPERMGWRLFAATALTSMAGIGTGIWPGRPPAVPVRSWSEDQGAVRLRLDGRLMNPPLETPLVVPRGRAP